MTARKWFDTVCAAMQGEVVIASETDEMIFGAVKGSKEKELFPLKMRDAGSSAGYQLIKAAGFIPQCAPHSNIAPHSAIDCNTVHCAPRYTFG